MTASKENTQNRGLDNAAGNRIEGLGERGRWYRPRAVARRCSHPPSTRFQELLGNTSISRETDARPEYKILNTQALKEIRQKLSENSSADLRGITQWYRENAADGCSLLCQDSTMMHPYPARGRNELIRATQGHTGDLYAALESLFGRRKVVSRDSLDVFLDGNFQPLEEANAPFKYIRLEDVFKSKGNSVNGPRREDIGRYNRKLFDMQFSQAKEAAQPRLRLNLDFFPEMNELLRSSRVIRSEYVTLHCFNGDSRFEIGDFILVIHENDDGIFCTIRNEKKLLFDKIALGSFCAGYSPRSRSIIFLYLDTFIPYDIEFVSGELAEEVYKAFFVL